MHSRAPTRSPWLISEGRRTLLVSLVASVVSAALLTIGRRSWPAVSELARTDLLGYLLLSCVLVWTTMTLLQILLTWLAYRGLTGPSFYGAVTADPTWARWSSRGKSWSRRLQMMGQGPASWPLTVSALSLIVVVVLALRPALREIPVALGLSLLMVAASWLNVVVQYAVHYARMDAKHEAFAFPGERPDSLADYLFLAVAVQSAFTVPDAQILTREMRRIVTGQALLAFAFNSVIVAMIVSLLLGIA